MSSELYRNYDWVSHSEQYVNYYSVNARVIKSAMKDIEFSMLTKEKQICSEKWLHTY